MITRKLLQLIETHCDELSTELAEKLHRTSRTAGFLLISRQEMVHATRNLYQNLGEWLLSKTEAEIEMHFTDVGRRRFAQKVPLDDVVWGITMSKETLWRYLRRETLADHALDLFNELEFLQMLDGFFDRATYYTVKSYEQAKVARVAA